MREVHIKDILPAFKNSVTERGGVIVRQKVPTAIHCCCVYRR
jgi:hypothetical protein